ncbi:MAG: Spy/CpxP family protein refolding chaperone [Rubrivivax sp.]|nr:Spy/CpxP family protein refolding chaperone [Rubrivivax sp.]MDH5339269.1 Spy/CpxP family protein refolding chaperone [Rubrivivax sp.]
MKIWIKRTLVGALGATLVFGGLAAWSHHGDHGHRWQVMSAEDAAGFQARIVERAAGKLDLDEAQRARLADLLDRVREQRNAIVSASAAPRAELQALVAGAAFDRARAQAWVDAMTDNVRAGSPAVIAAMGDFYDSLRPQQQTQLRDLLQRGGRWHGRS